MWIKPAQKMISLGLDSANIASKNGHSDRERTTLRKWFSMQQPLPPTLSTHALLNGPGFEEGVSLWDRRGGETQGG